MKRAIKPSRLALKPSISLAFILGLVSSLACLVLLLMPLSMLMKMALIVVIVAVSTYFILRDALLALPWSWRILSLNAKNEINFTFKNGQNFSVEILPNSVVMPMLIVLNVKLKGHYFLRRLILLSDSGDIDELRRWRVWLKWALSAHLL